MDASSDVVFIKFKEIAKDFNSFKRDFMFINFN